MEPIYKDAATIARLRSGPLGIYVDEFVRQLHTDGYPIPTIHFHVRCAVGFAKWLRKNAKDLRAVTDQNVRAYGKYRRRKGYVPCSIAVLHRLLNVIGGSDEKTRVRSCPKKMESAVPADYIAYLQRERGLSQTTINNHVHTIEAFLRLCSDEGIVELSDIRPLDLYKFLRLEASRRVGSANGATTAMRSFFRYLFYAGILQENFSATVPLAARWSNDSIPKSLPLESIHQVLAETSASTRIGRRDYAILILLARLGLRAGEVVSLKLDDIDWENGCLTVSGKTGVRPRLPLPQDVGTAIAAYLVDGRPKTTDRSVFLRDRAPYRGFSSSTAISTLVRRALKRADVDTVRKGAHLFRHSLACEMLRQGSSFDEIGDLLGHRSPNSTAVYAKVDLKALSGIALRWPGGEQ